MSQDFDGLFRCESVFAEPHGYGRESATLSALPGQDGPAPLTLTYYAPGLFVKGRHYRVAVAAVATGGVAAGGTPAQDRQEVLDYLAGYVRQLAVNVRSIHDWTDDQQMLAAIILEQMERLAQGS